jgi:hypothetical protein
MELGIQQPKFNVRQHAVASTTIGVAANDDVFDANTDNCVVDYGHELKRRLGGRDCQGCDARGHRRARA